MWRVACNLIAMETNVARVQEWKRMFGWASVRVQVLERPPHSQMNEREIQLIAEHGTKWPCGLNVTSGGDGIDPEVVRESWRNPVVRERHVQGRKHAWQDQKKRSNIMAGRSASAKVAKAKAEKKHNAPEANAKRTVTWEAQREKRLAGLTGKARAQKLARMNRDRERHRKKVAALTQGPPASSANRASSRKGQYESSEEE